jgi:hypothetical protein
MKIRYPVLAFAMACSSLRADIPYIAALPTTPEAVTPRAAEPPKSNPLYAPYEPLIGGVWRTDYPDQLGIKIHTETTYSWCANEGGIIATSVTVKGGIRTLESTGITTWNPAKKVFQFLSTSREIIGEGTTTIDDGALISDPTFTTADGKVAKALGRIKVNGSNSGTVQLFRLHEQEAIPHDKADWSKALIFKIERHPSA